MQNLPSQRPTCSELGPIMTGENCKELKLHNNLPNYHCSCDQWAYVLSNCWNVNLLDTLYLHLSTYSFLFYLTVFYLKHKHLSPISKMDHGEMDLPVNINLPCAEYRKYKYIGLSLITNANKMCTNVWIDYVNQLDEILAYVLITRWKFVSLQLIDGSRHIH